MSPSRLLVVNTQLKLAEMFSSIKDMKLKRLNPNSTRSNEDLTVLQSPCDEEPGRTKCVLVSLRNGKHKSELPGNQFLNEILKSPNLNETPVLNTVDADLASNSSNENVHSSHFYSSKDVDDRLNFMSENCHDESHNQSESFNPRLPNQSHSFNQPLYPSEDPNNCGTQNHLDSFDNESPYPLLNSPHGLQHASKGVNKERRGILDDFKHRSSFPSQDFNHSFQYPPENYPHETGYPRNKFRSASHFKVETDTRFPQKKLNYEHRLPSANSNIPPNWRQPSADRPKKAFAPLEKPPWKNNRKEKKFTPYQSNYLLDIGDANEYTSNYSINEMDASTRMQNFPDHNSYDDSPGYSLFNTNRPTREPTENGPRFTNDSNHDSHFESAPNVNSIHYPPSNRSSFGKHNGNTERHFHNKYGNKHEQKSKRYMGRRNNSRRYK